MAEVSTVPIDVSEVSDVSPLERAKTALMTEFGLFRHGANEVALEYARWVALRSARHAGDPADDSLLREFAKRMGTLPATRMESPGEDDDSIPDLSATYQALYGHALPPCWAAGSASQAAVYSPEPTGQGRRSVMGHDPAPTGQRRLSKTEGR